MWVGAVVFTERNTHRGVAYIADAERSQDIIVKAPEGFPVTSLSIRCAGYVKGNAEFYFDGATKQVSGDFNFLLGRGEYYGESATIEYKSIDVTAGEFRIKYEFFF